MSKTGYYAVKTKEEKIAVDYIEILTQTVAVLKINQL